ncbi:MAG: hypothetical protein V7638_3813 [Acidobacteriota bacterium]|jgi:cell wall-associated NlpC family hydrolase
MLTIANTIPAVSPDTIVAEARSHVGEPYRHLGRTNLGRDCLGLLLAVAKATKQIPEDFDYREYTEDTSAYQLEEELSKEMDRLDHWEEAQPGDVLLQKFHLRLPASHIIIISAQRGIYRWGIHASNNKSHPRCVEQRIAHDERNHAAFRLRGVTQWLR